MQPLVQTLLGLVVRRRVAQGQPPLAVQRHPVVRLGKILGREPEVDGMSCDPLEAPVGSEPGLARPLAPEHGRLRLPDHLDVPERVVDLVASEVEVVHPERLLEDRRVLVTREREHRRAVMEHVVPADLVRAVGEAVRVPVVRRGQEQTGGVRGSAREDDDVSADALRLAVSLNNDLRHGPSGRIRLQPDRLGIREQGDVGMLECGPHGAHLCIRLSVHDAREAVAVLAADAGAVRHVLLGEPDAAGRVEGVESRGREVVRQLLDPRLVRDGREGIRGAGRRVGRILAARAVHLVHLLSLRVVRLEIVVGDRPRR